MLSLELASSAHILKASINFKNIMLSLERNQDREFLAVLGYFKNIMLSLELLNHL